MKVEDAEAVYRLIQSDGWKLVEKYLEARMREWEGRIPGPDDDMTERQVFARLGERAGALSAIKGLLGHVAEHERQFKDYLKKQEAKSPKI